MFLRGDSVILVLRNPLGQTGTTGGTTENKDKDVPMGDVEETR